MEYTMTTCNDDNHILKDFIMPKAPSCYETDLISKLSAIVEVLKYEIQIHKILYSLLWWRYYKERYDKGDKIH
jgi:hypothetical protein